MINLNEERLKYIVISFLQGTHLDEITVRLQIECNQAKIGCKSLYQSISLITASCTNEELAVDDEIDSISSLRVEPTDEPDELLPAILGSLNIQKCSAADTPGQYEDLLTQSKNLHELLLLLYHDGYEHLGVLLELIETTKPKKRWTTILLTSTILTAGIGVLAYFKKEFFQAAIHWLHTTFPSVMLWLGKTFGLLRNIPLIGIIYNGLGLVWSWYHTFSNGTTTPTYKLHQLFFKTLTASLTISAYVVSFLAAGSMTLIAAFFFVLSSSTKVFQNLFNWWDSTRSLKALSEPISSDGWEVLAEYERAKNFHEQLLTSVWINLAAAIVTTTAVGLWSFFPPSLFLSIFCITFISLTALTERSYLNHIRDVSAENLQEAILKIKVPRPAYLRPGDKEDANKAKLIIQAREKDLDRREQQIIKQETAIKEQETKIDELLSEISARTHGLFKQRKIPPPPSTPNLSPSPYAIQPQ